MLKLDDIFKFNKNDRIVVGCSTGPDSMALVDMLLPSLSKASLFSSHFSIPFPSPVICV